MGLVTLGVDVGQRRDPTAIAVAEFDWRDEGERRVAHHTARFLERLSRMARLILFDKRGTGLSDRVSITELPTLEQRMDDVRAVMEAAGSRRAVLLGVSEGGPLCTLFAATHPARTEALVMIGSYARRMRADDYPWGTTQEERDAFCRTILDEWGGPVGIEERAPSRAHDPAFREWWASYLRMGASPGAAVALTRMNAAIDVRGVLPTIRVPTLVLHRTGDRRGHPAWQQAGEAVGNHDVYAHRQRRAASQHRRRGRRARERESGVGRLRTGGRAANA